MSGLPQAASPTVPSYGLAPQASLHGASAQIIRDPESDPPNLVVLADEQLTEELYLVARHVLMRDRRDVPTTRGRRVLTLMPDMLIRLETDEATKWQRPSCVLGSLTNTVVPEMRRRQPHARRAAVAGIGDVQLVFDHTNPIG